MHITPPRIKNTDNHRFKSILRKICAFGIRGVLKSIYYNFKLLPFSQAIRFPILVSRYTTLFACKKGSIRFISSKPRLGSLRIGLNDLDYSYESRSFMSIRGKLIIKGDGSHVFGPGVSLNIWKDGTLIIGNNFSVAPHLRMFVSNSIEIGDNNMWSFYNLVMDTDAHPIFDREGCLINHPQEINFGNNCWLGAYCKILKGANIPDGSIIGAGSTVTNTLANKNCIYIGHRLHKEDIKWESSIL